LNHQRTEILPPLAANHRKQMSTTTSTIDRKTTAPQTASNESGCCMGMSPPVKQHAWLHRFEGDWDSEGEIVMDPSQPPMKITGFDRARMIGGFWVVSEGRGNEMNFESRLTLGYDEKKQKYVGTWVDSMSSHLWHYEGTVDAAGRILTLETEGPQPDVPGKNVPFREVTEFKSDDHRVFTSSRLNADGKWATLVTIHFRRRK
jgi:hypothetical protein